MIYAVGGITTIICFLLSAVCLDESRISGNRFLKACVPAEPVTVKHLTQKQIICLSLLLTTGAAATLWQLSARVHDPVNFFKLALLLACLIGSACVDFIEHRIPNLFPGILAVGAVLILTFEYIAGHDGAVGYIVSGVFAAVVSSVCLLIGSLLSQQGIGAGDIKLIAALALLGGVYIAGGTLFFGMAACAAVSVCLLAAKRKKLKDAVPFAPFLLFGYMATIYIINF